MTEYDAMDWLWLISQTVPIALAWIFALYFCFTRHRENPRGAVFLAIAILLNGVWMVIGILPLFAEVDKLTELFSTMWFSYTFLTVKMICQTAAWILIALAVFSRRADQYADLS